MMDCFSEHSANAGDETHFIVEDVISKIQSKINHAHHYQFRRSTEDIYEVISQKGTTDAPLTYIVDLSKQEYSCHHWYLSGVPCSHALAINLKCGQNSFDFINHCFCVEHYQQTYATPILPIPDHIEWMLNTPSNDDD